MPSPGILRQGTAFSAKRRFQCSGAKDYVQKLKANFVLVRPEDRKKKIEGELRAWQAERVFGFTKTRTSWTW